jgi:cytochrome P450 family 2 subfamily U polypeptide 1
VKFFLKEFVILNSYEAIYEALVQKGNLFSFRPNDRAYRDMLDTENFSNIVRSQPSSHWKKLRKTCQKKIKMYDTGMQRIEDISNNMIENLVQEFKNQRGSFNPKELIYNAVMNMITTLLLGKTFSTEDELFKKMVELERRTLRVMVSSGRGAELDIFPWLRFFGNRTYKEIQQILELKQRVWELIKEEAVRGDMDQTPGEDDVRLVSALRETLMDENSGIEDKHLKVVAVNDMTFAGTTTTGNSATLFLNIISQHPKIQTNLQNEVDRVVGFGRCVSLADKADMPYTQATLLELLRYTSVAPLGVSHSLKDDATIQGKFVPAGANVSMNLYAMHHDEDFWDDPFKFQPERFLDDSGQLVSASHPNRRHLMPFSAGPRVCLGEILAKSRLFLIISALAQNFNIRPGKVTAPHDPRLLSYGAILSSAYYEIVAEERKHTV